MIRVPRSTLALLSSAAMVTATAGAAVAAPGQNRAQLPGSVPSWATAANRQAATAGSSPVDFKVYLDWNNSGQAADYALAASRGQARFLTPSQFRAKFAPSNSQVNAVEQWLQSQGFSVGFVPSNHKYVEATGTVDEASNAFQTDFGQYSVQGKVLRSNSKPLSVPSGLGIDGVLGLDESTALMKSYAAPPGAFVNATPCSSYWGEKTVTSDPPDPKTLPNGVQSLPSDPPDWAPCGYAGAQLQNVYGMGGAIGSKQTGGRGVTVAIIDAYASPTAADDLATYSDLHGLPAPSLKEYAAPGTYQRPDNPQHSPSGWSGEEALDLEAVHTMAPGADLVYVGSPNNRQDMDAALNMIVNNNLADIVSNSYGFSGEAVPPGYRKPFNDIAIQAAAEGISLFFSSGDSGDETGGLGGTPTPDWPASSPYVTAVGGTSLGIAEDNSRVFELGWETGKRKLLNNGSWGDANYQYGSGGGTSRFFTQPDWQAGVVPSSIATQYGGPAMRVVPDVSALGDPTTGMLIGQTQTFPDGSTRYSEYRIGGTSLSSPLYAGMFALVVEQTGRMGLPSPALYATANGTTTYDVQQPTGSDPTGAVRPDYVNGVDGSDGYVYSVRQFDFDTDLTIHVRNGYDDVTGLGSPMGQPWIDALVTWKAAHPG
ncbi:MAG TPA: S53 family peptidase [Nocardioidaceae bacterium]|nr:S53 family peptidase [Nocardioidaceae bacterium]